jgi:mersacidin/lichenicidin family type 2 lantibiotic
MNKNLIIRAWKDPEFRTRLTKAERAALPASPAGAPLTEFDSSDLTRAMQRLLTGLLRLVLKLFLKPVLSPRFPFTWQRRWMRVVARITLNAPGARVRPETLGGVSGDHILPEGEPGLALVYLHGRARRARW